ncbi:ornithine cyclodeaminase family protein [Mycobacterium antarcticum]|uniref:ornithine cyclodeaminase family protein n=1 Tax=unclassified Mycolicibacterium TaxID=2636767 RepID=UPI0024E141C0|nr:MULTISPECIES: ornithine cyclodeaminase family protein [unclassified Mycolicibacterium]
MSADDIRASVCFDDLIEPVARAFQESSASLADNGLVVMFPAERVELGDVYVKTGTLRGHDIFIVKVSPWFRSNAERGQPQGGFVGVFDSHTGRTLALLDDEHYLSDIRTAAAGAVAARLLAPSNVTTAAVLGAGTQAYWQTLALHRERPFTTLLIWARSRHKAELLKSRLTDELPGVDLRCSPDVERTVRDADVLITATTARQPLVQGAWLREGLHITAVGADDPTKCELDSTALRRARVFVDARETTAANGDVHRAIRAGQYSLEEISGELGEVISGQSVGRTSDTDITITKLVGIGAQDLVAAEVALARLPVPASSDRFTTISTE